MKLLKSYENNWKDCIYNLILHFSYLFIGYESKKLLFSVCWIWIQIMHVFVYWIWSKFCLSLSIGYESKFYLSFLFLWFCVFSCPYFLISHSLIVLLLCLLLLLWAYALFSRHVFFLEHIPFFSIHIESYNVSKSELVRIGHFFDDTDSFHVDIGTMVFDYHALPSSSTITPTPSKFVDYFPPHSNSQRLF